MTAGIRCPLCRGPTGVLDTRAVEGGIHRRRACCSIPCGGRTSTLEMHVACDRRGYGFDFVAVPRALLAKFRALFSAIYSSTENCEAPCASPDGSAIPVQDE